MFVKTLPIYVNVTSSTTQFGLNSVCYKCQFRLRISHYIDTLKSLDFVYFEGSFEYFLVIIINSNKYVNFLVDIFRQLPVRLAIVILLLYVFIFN